MRSTDQRSALMVAFRKVGLCTMYITDGGHWVEIEVQPGIDAFKVMNGDEMHQYRHLEDCEKVVRYDMIMDTLHFNWWRSFIWRRILGMPVRKTISYEPKNRMIIESDANSNIGIR